MGDGMASSMNRSSNHRNDELLRGDLGSILCIEQSGSTRSIANSRAEFGATNISYPSPTRKPLYPI